MYNSDLDYKKKLISKKFQTTSIGENYVPGLPNQYDFGRMNLHAHFATTT